MHPDERETSNAHAAVRPARADAITALEASDRLARQDCVATRAELARLSATAASLREVRVVLLDFGHCGLLADALAAYGLEQGLRVRVASGAAALADLATADAAALVVLAVHDARGLAALPQRLAALAPLRVLVVPDPQLASPGGPAFPAVTIETAGLRAQAGGWLDERRLGEDLPMLVPAAAAALARAVLAERRRLEGDSVKLVVTDLDGTLWGGVLGEDGPSRLAMTTRDGGAAFARYQARLAALAESGVLVAAISRNDPCDVRAVFDGHPGMTLRLSHLVALEASWQPKAQVLAALLDRLRVAASCAVFIDDDPVEQRLVAHALPEVLVPSTQGGSDLCLARLESDGVFATASSPEDVVRARSTRAALGLAAAARIAPDRNAVLASLRMRVSFEDLDDANRARAAQLTRRVTQFRTTSLVIAPDAGSENEADGEARVFLARLRDESADHGRVGLVVWRLAGEEAILELVCLSCRALNRDVETALLAEVERRARAAGARRLRARLERLARNEPARDLFARHGYGDEGGLATLSLTLPARAVPAHIACDHERRSP